MDRALLQVISLNYLYMYVKCLHGENSFLFYLILAINPIQNFLIELYFICIFRVKIHCLKKYIKKPIIQMLGLESARKGIYILLNIIIIKIVRNA